MYIYCISRGIENYVIAVNGSRSSFFGGDPYPTFENGPWGIFRFYHGGHNLTPPSGHLVLLENGLDRDGCHSLHYKEE